MDMSLRKKNWVIAAHSDSHRAYARLIFLWWTFLHPEIHEDYRQESIGNKFLNWSSPGRPFQKYFPPRGAKLQPLSPASHRNTGLKKIIYKGGDKAFGRALNHRRTIQSKFLRSHNHMAVTKKTNVDKNGLKTCACAKGNKMKPLCTEIPPSAKAAPPGFTLPNYMKEERREAACSHLIVVAKENALFFHSYSQKRRNIIGREIMIHILPLLLRFVTR